MRVTLIDYTGAGSPDPLYAMNLLIYTKNTRIKMSPNGLKEIAEWPLQKKLDELDYMANTIRSSWEFVDYTFMLEDVTRAFTHQLVRTRTASYAQQTMQILDVSGFGYYTGQSIEMASDRKDLYHDTMQTINESYKDLIAAGAKIEDARGLLPTNIHTNIVMKCNLRTLIDFCHQRISPRNAGETSIIAKAMRDEALRVHPWAAAFLARTWDAVAEDLDRLVQQEVPNHEKRTHMLKLVDQLRRGS